MEQHPVPQNVTTFQFRLIGDMTIKQFGYLCLGAMLAYISYKLPLPFFFTWPLAAFFALLGVGLAFVPVEERPMDIWVLSFFKSIYSPTQYLWSRSAKQQAPFPAATSQTSRPDKRAASKHVSSPAHAPEILSQPARPSAAKLDASSWSRILSINTQEPVNWFKNLFSPKPKRAPQSVSQSVQGSPLASSFSLGPTASLVGIRPQQAPDVSPKEPVASASAQQELEAQTKRIALEQKVGELESMLGDKNVSDNRILDLQSQLTQLLGEKRSMEEELIALRRKGAQQAAPTRAAGVVTGSYRDQPTINIITPELATRAGLPKLTTSPNVVTGIVKDNTGNLLPGVLVTVRDKDDVPLRALKTNKLGQFAASTPLPLGTYLVEVEDPRGRYTFDRAQIAVTGAIIPPIEVIAKSQKQVERQKLAQQIFGNQKM